MPDKTDSYYERKNTDYIDGTPIFKTPKDELNESEVASAIEKSWDCECHSFGKLAPLDWFFVRNGRLVGVGELKTASYPSTKGPSAILNVRKWLSLSLASTGLAVPGIFVVKFTDMTKFIDVAEIDASISRIGGCKKIVKSRNDIEPIIEVPISNMKKL